MMDRLLTGIQTKNESYISPIKKQSSQQQSQQKSQQGNEKLGEVNISKDDEASLNQSNSNIQGGSQKIDIQVSVNIPELSHNSFSQSQTGNPQAEHIFTNFSNIQENMFQGNNSQNFNNKTQQSLMYSYINKNDQSMEGIAPEQITEYSWMQGLDYSPNNNQDNLDNQDDGNGPRIQVKLSFNQGNQEYQNLSSSYYQIKKHSASASASRKKQTYQPTKCVTVPFTYQSQDQEEEKEYEQQEESQQEQQDVELQEESNILQTEIHQESSYQQEEEEVEEEEKDNNDSNNETPTKFSQLNQTSNMNTPQRGRVEVSHKRTNLSSSKRNIIEIAERRKQRRNKSNNKRNLSFIVYLSQWINRALKNYFNTIRAHYIHREYSPQKLKDRISLANAPVEQFTIKKVRGEEGKENQSTIRKEQIDEHLKERFNEKNSKEMEAIKNKNGSLRYIRIAKGLAKLSDLVPQYPEKKTIKKVDIWVRQEMFCFTIMRILSSAKSKQLMSGFKAINHSSLRKKQKEQQLKRVTQMIFKRLLQFEGEGMRKLKRETTRQKQRETALKRFVASTNKMVIDTIRIAFVKIEEVMNQKKQRIIQYSLLVSKLKDVINKIFLKQKREGMNKLREREVMRLEYNLNAKKVELLERQKRLLMNQMKEKSALRLVNTIIKKQLQLKKAAFDQIELKVSIKAQSLQKINIGLVKLVTLRKSLNQSNKYLVLSLLKIISQQKKNEIKMNSFKTMHSKLDQQSKSNKTRINVIRLFNTLNSIYVKNQKDAFQSIKSCSILRNQHANCQLIKLFTKLTTMLKMKKQSAFIKIVNYSTAQQVLELQYQSNQRYQNIISADLVCHKLDKLVIKRYKYGLEKIKEHVEHSQKMKKQKQQQQKMFYLGLSVNLSHFIKKNQKNNLNRAFKQIKEFNKTKRNSQFYQQNSITLMVQVLQNFYKKQVFSRLILNKNKSKKLSKLNTFIAKRQKQIGFNSLVSNNSRYSIKSQSLKIIFNSFIHQILSIKQNTFKMLKQHNQIKERKVRSINVLKKVLTKILLSKLKNSMQALKAVNKIKNTKKQKVLRLNYFVNTLNRQVQSAYKRPISYSFNCIKLKQARIGYLQNLFTHLELKLEHEAQFKAFKSIQSYSQIQFRNEKLSAMLQQLYNSKILRLYDTFFKVIKQTSIATAYLQQYTQQTLSPIKKRQIHSTIKQCYPPIMNDVISSLNQVNIRQKQCYVTISFQLEKYLSQQYRSAFRQIKAYSATLKINQFFKHVVKVWNGQNAKLKRNSFIRIQLESQNQYQQQIASNKNQGATNLFNILSNKISTQQLGALTSIYNQAQKEILKRQTQANAIKQILQKQRLRLLLESLFLWRQINHQENVTLQAKQQPQQDDIISDVMSFFKQRRNFEKYVDTALKEAHHQAFNSNTKLKKRQSDTTDVRNYHKLAMSQGQQLLEVSSPNTNATVVSNSKKYGLEAEICDSVDIDSKAFPQKQMSFSYKNKNLLVPPTISHSNSDKTSQPSSYNANSQLIRSGLSEGVQNIWSQELPAQLISLDIQKSKSQDKLIRQASELNIQEYYQPNQYEQNQYQVEGQEYQDYSQGFGYPDEFENNEQLMQGLPVEDSEEEGQQ